MSSSSSSSSVNGGGGISLGSILFVIFLTLKLTGNIAWSWWWVTSPLWIYAGFYVFVVGIFALLIIKDKF